MITSKSVVFLLILVAIVLFLVGVNIGKESEKIDKKVRSAVPSPTQTVPSFTPLSFSPYIHTGCGITFLSPSSLKETHTSSTAATLENENESIQLNCDKQENENFATTSANIQSTDTRTYKNIKFPIYEKNKNQTVFQIKNTTNNKSIFFTTTHALLPLLLKTLEFSK